MKKKLLFLLGSMLLMALAGVFIITITGREKGVTSDQKNSKIKVVTTFYPVYMIGLNIADQINELEVYSLTELNTGCLHDYQLTTKDLRIISEADVMVINGGGMESFLNDVIANYPDLSIIDASEGIEMLSNAEEGLLLEHAEDELHTHEHGEHGEYNAHVWLDPKLYIKQIENVRDGLIRVVEEAKPKLSESSTNSTTEALIQRLKENTQEYIEQVSVLDKELEAYVTDLTLTAASSAAEQQNGLRRDAVIFHDAFAYLASRAGINVVFTVPLDSDTALSAGDIGKIIDEVQNKKIKYLFTEQQYSDSIAKQIEAETGAKVYIIDSAVTGNGEKDSYLGAMYANLEVLKAFIR